MADRLPRPKPKSRSDPRGPVAIPRIQYRPVRRLGTGGSVEIVYEPAAIVQTISTSIPRDLAGRNRMVRRLARQYTQKEIAHALGLTQQSVSRLIRGLRHGKDRRKR